jgi:hypothetical protein
VQDIHLFEPLHFVLFFEVDTEVFISYSEDFLFIAPLGFAASPLAGGSI